MNEYLVIGLWPDGGRWANTYRAPDPDAAEVLAIAEYGETLKIAGVVQLVDGKMEVVG